MHRSFSASIAVLLVAASACYHATVDTGLTPSTVVVEKSWASGWIYGLVPPSTVETGSKCQHGVAKVETQHSFLNMLVGGLTGGIYTPMSIKVTCAQAGHASASPTAPTINLGANATTEQIQSAIDRAANLSLRTGEPVYVEY
jgi:Bor protein